MPRNWILKNESTMHCNPKPPGCAFKDEKDYCGCFKCSLNPENKDKDQTMLVNMPDELRKENYF